MINNFSVLAVVPARGGSKRVPRKNIKLLAGKPLIVYSIEQAQASKYIDRIILSSEDQEIIKVGQAAGAEVPFIRPIELASDLANDFQVFFHLLNWLQEHEGKVPDIIVQLRPTSPLRKVEQIDQALEMLINQPEADSVRTVTLPEQTPYKMYTLDEQGFLQPLFPGKLPDGCEYINAPLQSLPQAYKHIGSVDVFWAKTILEKKSMVGEKILPLIISQGINGINTEADWEKYEYLLSQNQQNV